MPLLVNMAKGRASQHRNIELVVKDNRTLAWTIFISANSYITPVPDQTVVEALQKIRAEDSGRLIVKNSPECCIVKP